VAGVPGRRVTTMRGVRTFDVIVVGAGPAGSTAAYRLASQGARVALLDKATFPRDKPCGGGITVRGLRHLPIDVTPVVEDAITDVEIGFGYRDRIERTSDAPLVLMTQRRRLDAHLADAAAGAGADFRDGVRVRDIELTDGGAVVATDTDRLTAAAVIGADGCNGVSAKALGLGDRVTYGVAYEGNVPWGILPRERWQSRLLLEFDSIPGGYAWIFPKGDHANLGVGGWGREAPNLRDHIARLCDFAGVPVEAMEHARGYRLPLRRPGVAVARERALVIGDAAGLVDPMSGDGMYEAFLSSRLASEAVADLLAGRTNDLTGFQATLDGALSRHRAVSWAGKLLFDDAPGLARRLAASRWLWPRVVRRIRGDTYHRRGPGSARLEAAARTLYRPTRG
jgi:geranylgeranyl reductase family protein